MKKHTVPEILEAISDSRSLDFFCSIAKGGVKCNVLKETKGFTRKQYYSRTARLVKVGLVQRVKGRFSLTNFGIVVYHAQLLVLLAVKNYWKLKVVDSIQSSDGISEYEQSKLIKTIIGDNTIENILVK